MARPRPLRAAIATIAITPAAGLASAAGAADAPRSIHTAGFTVHLWTDPDTNRDLYTVTRDSHTTRPRPTTILLDTRLARFDPLLEAPPIPAALAAVPSLAARPGAHIVQFFIPPLPEFYHQVAALGGTVRRTLHHNAAIVEMDSAAAAAVAALPAVRWVGPFHPALKLDLPLVAALAGADAPLPTQTYSILLTHEGEAPQTTMAARISTLGGVVTLRSPNTARLEATLSPHQLFEVARSPHTLFIDVPGPPETDMDIQRQLSGADYIEQQGGYNGSGVRAEVMDIALNTNHFAFNAPPASTLSPIIRGTNPAPSFHSTASYGIMFADGDPEPAARGHLPHAQGYFIPFSAIGPLGDRWTITQGTVQNECVVQSNGWGSPRTTLYTTLSAEMDDIVFDHDITIVQSLSNSGFAEGRPEAWAKNVVAIGGFQHLNTATRADDTASGASTGPASDGRTKPELTNFYDAVFTAAACDDCFADFGGTSAGTPATAGAIALIYEMWADGIFGNMVSGGSVFAERPHEATARALAINTAFQYDWNTPGPNASLTRERQGWGMADLAALYDARSRILVIDETDPIVPLATNTYRLSVAPSEPALRITMCYADRPGNPASQSQHRINDLSLRVTSPTGVQYWGNHNLAAAVWSAPGGDADTKNTIENVFIQNPAPGVWTVEVIADEILEDGRPETPALDADYALVATGATPAPCQPDITTTAIPGAPGYLVPDGVLNNDDFFAFLTEFAAGNLAVCDLTTTAVAGQPGYGVPNGQLTNDDFFYYLALFAAGC